MRILLFIILVLSLLGLTSCYPTQEYGVKDEIVTKTKRLLGPGRDTIKVGDKLTIKKVFEIGSDICVKNARTGAWHIVDSKLLFNLDTGKSMYEDLQTKDRGNLWEERIPTLKIPEETLKTYERYMIIGAIVLLVLCVVGFFLLLRENINRTMIGVYYSLLSLVSLFTNVLFFIYSSCDTWGYYEYLFSPSVYGWGHTILYWIACFVLIGVNLFAYKAVIMLSEVWSGRNSCTGYAFLAVVVWAVVYLFSSNTLNDYFLWALYGIVALHLIALFIVNMKVKANVFEMFYIFFYFWICLLPVVLSTLTTIVLIPLLLFAFAIVRSVPSMFAEAFKIDDGKEKKVVGKPVFGEKTCQFCQFYKHGSCEKYLPEDKYDGKAYSCPFYS